MFCSDIDLKFKLPFSISDYFNQNESFKDKSRKRHHGVGEFPNKDNSRKLPLYDFLLIGCYK